MSQSPIPRVLSTFQRHRVKALLMGGQACILYGAAEFTRDVDFAVAVGAENLHRLRAALDELEAEPVFFPLLSAAVLRRGHACHSRSGAAGLHGLRIDVMSTMRGVDSFGKLWRRREEFELPGVGRVAALSLPDLMKAKKTQRDKDWPMIRRLIEADVARAPSRVPATRCRSVLAAGMSELRAATRSGPRSPRAGSACPPARSARGDHRRGGTDGRAAPEGRGPRAAAGPALLGSTTLGAGALASKPTAVGSPGRSPATRSVGGCRGLTVSEA